MTQTILAYGDSNTHGTPPMTSTAQHPRLTTRWPVVLAETSGMQVIAEGLPGRLACPQIPTAGEPHRDGPLGLQIALHSHGPIDHLLIMLGTNDLKEAAGKTPEAIVAGLAGLIAMARTAEMQEIHGDFTMTLIAPPAVQEIGTFVPEMRGAAAKSGPLTAGIKALAADWQIGFIDAGAHITTSPVDGVHFDAAAHDRLGQAVAAHLTSLG